MRLTRWQALALGWSLVFVPACTGSIERPDGPAHDNGSGAPPVGAGAPVGTGAPVGPEQPGAGPGSSGQGSKFVYECAEPQARGASDGKLRRLTQPELVSTLSALVGSDVMRDSLIQTQLGLLPADKVITSILDVAESPAASQPSAMLEIALRAAELVSSREASLKRVFGTCASLASFPDDCLRAFVSRFGSQVFRRPLSDAEKERVLTQYRAAGDAGEGMRRILARLLMSPSLAFHLEPGASQAGGRVRLTDHEVASRLAYRLTGTMPDDALLQAADAGWLRTLDDLRSQAERLLSSPGFRQRLGDFFRFYTQLYSVPTPNAFAARLDGISDPKGFVSELAQETLDFIDNVVWTQKAGFTELLTSTQVFPRSAQMAKILEATPVSGSAPATTNADHAGLLLRPAFLADAGLLTRPYHRALRIRAGMLCETFGVPDPGAIAARRDELGDLALLSNRERLNAETNAPLCLGCHRTLNPVGFVLESHDQLGMKRNLESNFDAQTGALLRTHPIDTMVTNTFIRDDSGVVDSFASARDLVRALAAGIEARGCFARRVFEYQRARPKAAADACALRDVEDVLARRGSVIEAFIASVVNEDIFYKADGT